MMAMKAPAIAAVLAASLFCVVPAPVRAADGAAPAYARVRPALVRVWALDARGVPVDSGTGFVIASGAEGSTIVTAAHVAKDAVVIKVDVNRQVHDLPATVVAKGAGDVLVLRVAQNGLKTVDLAAKLPAAGDTIAVAGYPGTTAADALVSGLGEEPQLLFPGTVSSLVQSGKLLEIANVAIEHGFSGGPVFDPNTGDILGIVDAKMQSSRTAIAIAMPTVIEGFLDGQHIAYVKGAGKALGGNGLAFTKGDTHQEAMQRAFFAENYAAAASLASDYLVSHPDDLIANGVVVAAMRALFLAKAEDQGARSARQYLVSHPRDTMANAIVASSLRATHPEDAVARFDAIGAIPLEFRPYAAEAYYNAALDRLKTHDREGAIACLRRSVQYGPNAENRAMLASLTGDAKAATASVPSTKTLQEYANELAGHVREGRLDEAATVAREAHQSYPDDGSVPFNLFNAFQRKAKVASAADHWRDAIDLYLHGAREMEPISKPYAIKLYVLAGNILGQKGANSRDVAEAVQVKNRILALDAASCLGNLYAAMLSRYQLNDRESARKYLLAAKAHASEENETNQQILAQEMRDLGIQ